MSQFQAQSRWVPLRRPVRSQSIHPLSRDVIREHELPAGLMIQDPFSILSHAVLGGVSEVLVRTMDQDGWGGMERLDAEALRAALDDRAE
jgi:hypothetical protein